MTRHRNHLAALLTIGGGLFFAVPAQAGSWLSNAPFGATLNGDLYTPTNPAASPAIIVAIHYCGGNSGNAHGWFQSAADQYGFYIIAPNAGKNCFDSSASRSGDPAAIVAMVKYVLTNKNADASRVFAAGYSSGGCMTNTLLAVYPDVFAGGSALPGYPAGAWPSGDTSCSLCGQANRPNSSDTGQKYADQVKGVFSWSGTRPCSQQWVGGGDQYHFNSWLPVTASEFQILGNLDSGSPGTGAPSGWTRTVYKDSSGNIRLETNLGPSSQAHDLTPNGLNGNVISFLGLDKATGACGIATSGGTGGAGGGGGQADSGVGGRSDSGAGGRNPGFDAIPLGSGGMSGSGGSSSGGGGQSSGGATGSGGVTAKGGASGSGGAETTGGASGAGGASSKGGVSGGGVAGQAGASSGGAIGAGGATAAGGSSASKGGSVGGGGAIASGGSAAQGSGGSASSGGAVGNGGTSGGSTAGGGGSNGCGCELGGRGGRSTSVAANLLMVAMGMIFRSRRQARR